MGPSWPSDWEAAAGLLRQCCSADKDGMKRSRSSFVSCVVVITLAAAAFGSTGCTSMRPIPLSAAPTDAPFGKVKVGDSVFVQMKDGRRERFVVRGVEGDELVSDRGVRYRSADISVLKRRSFSPGKTTALAAGTTVGVLFLAVAAAAASLLNAGAY
jgi:hypothetical protein